MVWDSLKGEIVERLPVAGKCGCVKVSPDGTAVATASWDSHIRIFTRLEN